jgi:hypothetical protein
MRLLVTSTAVVLTSLNSLKRVEQLLRFSKLQPKPAYGTSDHITRRSRVQIPPPLLEKPRKRGFLEPERPLV